MASIQPQKGGLRWVKSRTNPGLGTPPIVEKVVLSNNTTAIFTGDLVKSETGGTVVVAAAGDAASHVCIGVVQYKTADGIVRGGSYLPAATTYTGTVARENPEASVLLCIPVTGQVFEVDVPTGAATQTAATALIGQCVDIVATAGETTTGISGFTTDTVANFAATTASAQLRLLEIPMYGIGGSQANDVTSTYWKGWFEVYEITETV